MKGRISPSKKKEKEPYNLKTDSSDWLHDVIRNLASVKVMIKWALAKISFICEFWQNRDTKCNVYVVIPRKCFQKHFYKLFLTAAYIIVNTNTKFQEHCDSLFLSLGVTQSHNHSTVEIIAVKINW